MAGTTLSSQPGALVAGDTPLLTFALARKISVFLLASGFHILRLPTFIIATTCILLMPSPAKALYSYFGDSKYTTVEGPTWEEAQANAAILGGYLVAINDMEENDWVTSTFGRGGINNSGGFYKYWIGLHRPSPMQSLTWVSGEPLSYQIFHQGSSADFNSAGRGPWEDYAYINLWKTVVDYPANNGVWVPYENFHPNYDGMDMLGIVEIKLSAPSGTSTASVPGPLPILGLAAAFGFSRKLRKRIKLHRETSSVSTSLGA